MDWRCSAVICFLFFTYASFASADTPVKDTFDDFNSEGWSTLTGLYGSESANCFLDDCIKTAQAGTAIIEKSGIGVSEGGFTVYGKRNVGLFGALAKLGIADGTCSSSNCHFYQNFLPNDNTWHRVSIFWRNGPGSDKESCLLVDSLDQSNCTWKTSLSGEIIPNSSNITHIRLDGQVSRPDFGDLVWWDELQDVPPITYISGAISTNTTFSSTSVHILSATTTINSGVTLTLEPGAILKFKTATSSLVVNGTLDSGDISLSNPYPVVLTSYRDDFIGGDTNGNGNANSPAGGDWSGILINSGGVVNLENTIVRYGNSVNGSNAMIHNNGGTLNVASSTIAYGNNYGLKNSSGVSTITGTDIAFNTYGLYLDGGSIDISATSTIHDNSVYGAFNNTSATSSFLAINNYWGTTTATTTGPYNPTYNPSGTGNAVSDYIDFDPWVGKTGTSSLPHYLISDSFTLCHPNLCSSVQNGEIVLDASTTPYKIETNGATSTWNALGNVTIIAPTSTFADAAIYAVDNSAVVWKGQWFPDEYEPDPIFINTYYLRYSTSAQRQNTITHELGHALGLDHSYTGNVMFFNQSPQTTLGPQDIHDYYSLWP